MKLKIFILLQLLSVTAFSQSITKKILFIGNSLTYVNDLPLLTSQMASSVGDSLIYTTQAFGGWTLIQHSQSAATVNLIAQGGWDKVVLQDQSQQMAITPYNAIGLSGLNEDIKHFNPCTEKTLLFQTWGYQNGDPFLCATYPYACTYQGMDSVLSVTCEKEAIDYKAELAPVGRVWHYLKANYPGMNLYSADNVHPSIHGSYAAACVFYTAIFEKDPTFITFNSTLSATDAQNIRAAVKLLVFDSLAKWHIGMYPPPALPDPIFSYRATNINRQITFENNTFFKDFYKNFNYTWDFGDGTTFSQPNNSIIFFNHTFPANTSYTVTLVASKCNYSDTITAVLNFCNHASTITPAYQMICPQDSAILSSSVADSYQWFDGSNQPIVGGNIQNISLPYDSFFYINLATTVNGCTELAPAAVIDHYSTSTINYYSTLVNGKIIDSNSVCIGDTLTLVLQENFGTSNPTMGIIKWYKNNNEIIGANNDTLLVTDSGDYIVKFTHSTCPKENYYVHNFGTYKFDYCFPLIIDTRNIQEDGLKIYPNPSTDIITLNSVSDGMYNIFNATGQKISSIYLLKNVPKTIAITNLHTGIYFVNAIVNGNIVSKKFEVIK